MSVFRITRSRFLAFAVVSSVLLASISFVTLRFLRGPEHEGGPLYRSEPLSVERNWEPVRIYDYDHVPELQQIIHDFESGKDL